MYHLKPQTLTYGTHELQRILIWLAEPAPASPATTDSSKPWLIFIHGGGWRDPQILADTLQPTLKALYAQHHSSSSDPASSSSSIISRLGGIASIDYRLSPHPNHPQDPSTPESKLRNAKHPDHVVDVKKALKTLQDKYGFGGNYLLMGHSVGATLAFQMVMKNVISQPTSGTEDGQVDADAESIHRPKCIIGVSGIYNIRAMVDYHHTVPIYRQMVAGALGENEEVWDRLSPALYKGLKEDWKEAKKIVLAHSENDGLVEGEQLDAMVKTLVEEGLEAKYVRGKIESQHDEVWEKGTELVGLVDLALEDLS